MRNYLKHLVQGEVTVIQELIKTVRNIKAEMNIPLTRKLDLQIRVVNSKKEKLIQENIAYLRNLAHVDDILMGNDLKKPEYSAMGVLEDIEIFIPLKGVIDIEAEVERLEQKLTKIEKELILINKN